MKNSKKERERERESGGIANMSYIQYERYYNIIQLE